MPTEEARRQRRMFNIALTVVATAMFLVFAATVIVISLQVSGNTTTLRLDSSSTLASCRAASTARLNRARVNSDHAQSAAILIGVDAATGRTVSQEQIDYVRDVVADTDAALTEAQNQYQEEYELSNKDKDEFISDCRERGDI